jgi:TetR/AcrR family transcriptional regulator, regulator of autoinduction and epiphytic fitness
MANPVKPKRAYNTALRQEQARSTRLRILEAARQLFVTRSYSAVTMDEIAREAGVAYQTVYAAFGNKVSIAREIIWSSFEVEGVHDLIAEAKESADPEVWLRSTARVAHVISERLGDLLRFLRESGDQDLIAEYEKVEQRRFEQEQTLLEMVAETGRLKDGLSASEALAVVWAMTGTQLHSQLVVQRKWTGSRYEEWLGDALIALLLAPRAES